MQCLVISNIPIILCLNSPISSQDIPGYPCSVLSLTTFPLSYVLTVLFRPRTSRDILKCLVISNIPIILCLNSPILYQDIPGYPCSVLSLAISLLSYVLQSYFVPGHPRTSLQCLVISNIPIILCLTVLFHPRTSQDILVVSCH